MHCSIATHAAAFLLLQAPDRAMQAAKLMQLLYMADREHVLKHGHVMTNCTRMSTENGPVHSEIYAAIRDRNEDALDFLMIIDGEKVRLAENVEVAALDELSSANEEILLAIWKAFGSENVDAITIAVMSGYREWKQNADIGKGIQILDVFVAAGIENAREIVEATSTFRSVPEVLEDVRTSLIRIDGSAECASKRNAQYVLKKMGLCPSEEPDKILERIQSMTAQIKELEEQVQRYSEAPTPSLSTTAASDREEIGPWQYRPNKHDDWGLIRNIDGAVIGTIRDPNAISPEILNDHREKGTDPWERYGRLASNAPTLLKALERLMPTFAYLERNGHRVDPEDVDFARKTIAEAKGTAI